MVRKIAFINGKGGCGKTMSIFQIAGVLSKKDEKVLIIDLDKQRNSSDGFLMNNAERPEKTVLDFFRGEADVSETVAPALFQTRGNAKAKYFGVDCMVSDIDLQDEANLAGIDGEYVKEQLDRFIEEQGYSWVLVDMPPSNLTLNNLCFRYIVDYTIIPLSSDKASVDGFADIMNIMEEARKINPTLNVLGAYLSRYKGSGLHNAIREQLMEYGDIFIDIQIPDATDLEEAVFFGRPISYYKTFSKSRKAFEDLVKEIKRQTKK